jgi:hypothetical protein
MATRQTSTVGPSAVSLETRIECRSFAAAGWPGIVGRADNSPVRLLLIGAFKRSFARFQILQRLVEKSNHLGLLRPTPGLAIVPLCFFDATPYVHDTSVQSCQFMRPFPHERTLPG